MTTTAVAAPATPVATGSRTTSLLLLCGVLAGPLYLVVSYAQALTRDGFDLTRHPFSALSLGDLGWIQMANFVLAGLLYVAAAAGIRRALRTTPGGTWGPRLIAALGVGMIAGGVFVMDPAGGFPPGTPDAAAAGSWHGTLHGVAFIVAVIAWIAACFVFTRRFAAAGRPVWATYCAVTGVLLAVPPALPAGRAGIVLLYVAASLGWLWISALTAHLLAQTR